jgi:hypothetical protein
MLEFYFINIKESCFFFATFWILFKYGDIKNPQILANLAHFFHKNPLHELQIGFFGSPNGKRLPKKHWWKSSNVA